MHDARPTVVFGFCSRSVYAGKVYVLFDHISQKRYNETNLAFTSEVNDRNTS